MAGYPYIETKNIFEQREIRQAVGLIFGTHDAGAYRCRRMFRSCEDRPINKKCIVCAVTAVVEETRKQAKEEATRETKEKVRKEGLTALQNGL